MSDQGYTYLASGCPGCRVYKGDKAIRPAFIITERYGHRYWTCPMCEGSYGEVEPQPQAVTEDARDGERLDALEELVHRSLSVKIYGNRKKGGFAIECWGDESEPDGKPTLREAIDAARRAQTSSGKGDSDA